MTSFESGAAKSRLPTVFQNHLTERKNEAAAFDGSFHVDDDTAVGRYDGLTLASAFQPILSTGDLRVVGHEALLRARSESGETLSPQEAFQRPSSSSHIACFDCMCRAVHVTNFAMQAPGDKLLFLNVDARRFLDADMRTYDHAFARLLIAGGFDPRRVVLEVLESHVDDMGLLADVVADHQSQGFRVAIDDFGSNGSNFDRLWRLAPDIVKIDRHLIERAMVSAPARKLLPRIVEIVHDLDAKAICEGIETQDQFMFAMDVGADMVQGYYFARPAAKLVDAVDIVVDSREDIRLAG